MPGKDVAREAAWSAMQAARDTVTRVAREIHNDPELAGAEVRAVERLTGLLREHGFDVEVGVAGLPTAFRATKRRHDAEQMRNGLRHGHVAYLAEYDALPGVGHAHGHHLGAGAAALAAIGLAGALESELGDVTVFGCPAATERRGKLVMAEAGLFEAPDVALGAHPAPPGEGYFYTIDDSGDTLAELRVIARFAGDEADKALLATTIEASRDGYTDRDTVRAEATPAGVCVTYQARDRERVVALRKGLREVVYAALGPTASVEFADAPLCDDMLVNRVLARRMKTCGDNLGLRMDDIRKAPPTRATDWGGVSRVVASFEALFPITAEPVDWGEEGFARVSGADEAYAQMLRVGECLCFTGIDVLRDMNFRAVVDSQLVKGLRARGVERPFRRWLGVHPVLPKASMNGGRGPKVESFRILNAPASNHGLHLLSEAEE